MQIPCGEDETKADLYLRVTARDASNITDPLAPVETEPVANGASVTWEGLPHVVLPAGMGSSSTVLLVQLWDLEELVAFGEVALPPEETGSVTTALQVNAANSSRAAGEMETVELTFEFAVGSV